MKPIFSIPPSKEPTVWSTDNGWKDWTELPLNDVLALKDPPPGADIWSAITVVHGINDAGQVVGLAEFLVSSAGPTSLAQGVFLLDTLPLDLVLKGDVDNDGSVDNLDITPFIAALAAEDEAAFLVAFPGGSYAAADIDMSGSPNNLDITAFIGLLAGSGGESAAVPEPSSIAWIVLALMASRRRSKKRLGYRLLTSLVQERIPAAKRC